MALSPNLEKYFNTLEDNKGLPRGTLKSVASIESNFNPKASAKGSSAKGMFQFTDGTAKDYKLRDPFDPYASADAAANYISRNMKRYDGDIQKAVLAFHTGPGEVDKYGTDTSKMSKYVNRGYLNEFNKRYNKFGDGTMMNNIQTASNNNENIENNNQNMATDADGIMKEFGLTNTQPITTVNNNIQTASSDFQSNNNIDGDVSLTNNIPQQEGIVTPDQNNEIQQQAQSTQNNQIATDADGIMKEFGLTNTQPMNINQQPQNQPNTTINNQNNKDSLIYNKFTSTSDPIGYYQSLTPAQQNVLDQSLRSHLEANPQEVQAIQQNGGRLANFMQGVVMGMNKGVQTVKQIAGKAIGNENWENEATQNLKDQETYERLNSVINPERSGYNTAGQIGGEVLGSVALPQAKIAQLGRYGNIALNAGVGAGLFSSTTSEGDDYWKDKALQAGVGAVAGPVVAKGIDSVAAPVAGFIGRTLSKTPAKTQAEIDAMARQGYEYYAGNLSDVNSPRTLNYIARTDADVNAALRDNVDKAVGNIEDFAQSIGSGRVDTDAYVNKYARVLAQSADNSDPYYQGLAKDAINTLKNANQANPNELLKSMANLQWLDRRLANKANYDAVDAIAPTGNGSVASSYNRFVSDLEKQVQNNAYPDTETDSVLSLLKQNKFDTSNMTIEQYNSSIRQLNAKARTAKKNGNDTENLQYTNAVKALEADKATHLANTAGDQDYANAYRTAQNFNRENIASVKKDGDLSNLFNMKDNMGNDITPDKLMDTWLRKGDVSNIKKLYGQLDTESQNVFKNATLSKLYNDAINKNDNLNIDSFNRAYNAFAVKNSAGRSVNPLDAVFSGPEKSNFSNLIKGIKRFKTYTASQQDPQTGALSFDKVVKYFPALATAIGAAGTVGTGGALPIILGIGTGAGSALAKNAYIAAARNPAAAKYFVKLSKVSPGTQEFVDTLGEILRRGAPAATSDVLVGNPADPQNSGPINQYFGASGQNQQNNLTYKDNTDYFSNDLSGKNQQNSQTRDYFSEDLNKRK